MPTLSPHEAYAVGALIGTPAGAGTVLWHAWRNVRRHIRAGCVLHSQDPTCRLIGRREFTP